MIELMHSPYIGYIVFAIVFTLSSLTLLAIHAQREFKRVKAELCP